MIRDITIPRCLFCRMDFKKKWALAIPRNQPPNDIALGFRVWRRELWKRNHCDLLADEEDR